MCGQSAATAGIDCWSAVIPAQPADAGQYDNHYGGSGFMMSALDFDSFVGIPLRGRQPDRGVGLDRARNLNSGGCGSCSAVKFGGQVFTGTPVLRPMRAILGSGLCSPESGADSAG